MSATPPLPPEPGPPTTQTTSSTTNPSSAPTSTAYVVILTGQEECGGHTIGSELAWCLNTRFTRGFEANENSRLYAQAIAGNAPRGLYSHVYQRTWFTHMLRLGFSTTTTWYGGIPPQQWITLGSWRGQLVLRPERDANLSTGAAMSQAWDCRGVISSSALMRSGREAVRDLLVREHGIRPVFVIMQIESWFERLRVYGDVLEEDEDESENGSEALVSEQGAVNVRRTRMGEHVERVGSDTVVIRSYGRDIDGLLRHILHETARIVGSF